MSGEEERVKSDKKPKNCLKESIDRFEKAHARILIMEVIFFLILLVFLLLFIFSF